MPPTVRIEPAEEVPTGACVCHYDELADAAKQRLQAVAGASASTTSDRALEAAAEDCDLVKFTDYYRLERV